MDRLSGLTAFVRTADLGSAGALPSLLPAVSVTSKAASL